MPVRQLYGCTEAGAVTVNLDGDPDATAGSVGRPLDGVEIQIVDDDGRRARARARGRDPVPRARR